MQINLKYIRVTRNISEIFSVVVFLTGAIVLCGWIFNIQILQSFGSGYSNMKTNAAICAVLSGIALFFAQEKRTSKRNRAVAAFSAAIIFTITFLTIIEDFCNIDFGIDELIFKDVFYALYTSHPNRMSPIASLGFFAFSVFMLLRPLNNKTAFYISRAIVFFTGFLSMLSFVNYIFGSPYFIIDISSYTNIALGASLSLFFIFLSGIFLQVEKSLVAVLVSSGKAGYISRTLVITAPVVILMIDFTILEGHKIGLYDLKYVSALHYVFETTFLITLIFLISRSLEKSDSLKNQYIRKLEEKELSLQEKNEEIEAQNEEFKALNEELNDSNKLLTHSFAELNNLKTHLEIKVQERTDDLSKLNEEIKKSELLYRTLFEYAKEGIAYISLTGDVLRANASYAGMLGYSVDEIQKMNIRQFDVPESAEKIEERISRLLTGESLSFEVGNYHKNGSVIPIEISATLITVGSEKMIIAFFRDFSERKKAGEALLYSQNFLNETGKIAKVGGWDLDLIAGTLYWTEGVYLIHETEPGFVPTLENAINFYAPGSKELIMQAVQKATEKAEPFDMELEIITAKGNRLWVHAIGKPFLKFGKVIKISGTFQDIHGKKTDELMLQRKNFEIEASNEEYASLNEELKQTNEQLNRAREKAEEADKLKSSFLANMSHEIRTPLNGIMGFSRMLTKPGLPETKQKMYSNLVNTCSEQLINIIDDLIDISKIEANQVKIQDHVIDLKELMNGIYTQLEPKVKAKNLAFKLIIPAVAGNGIITDGLRLRQVLTNLINNSVKFTHSGSIEFGYKFLEYHIEFYVKDTGIGIEKNKHEIIFERFRQAEIKTSQDYGGNGLGLSISRSLVHLLGGSIRVDSAYGLGSTFYFTIALRPAIPLNKPVTASKTGERKFPDKDILIVDDEIINFSFLKEALTEMGLNRILYAKSGNEAVEAVKSNPDIGLVLMDLKMPGMDGFETTTRIRSINAGLPVIAQSAYAQESEIEKALQCGCISYIVKPINLEELGTKVSMYFKK